MKKASALRGDGGLPGDLLPAPVIKMVARGRRGFICTAAITNELKSGSTFHLTMKT